MGATYGNKAIKIYTKTKHFKKDNTYQPKMYGVIEGPVNQMLKYFPKEFKFLRHETKQMLRAPRKKKKKDEQ